MHNRPLYYILDGKLPIAVLTIQEWAAWNESNSEGGRVAKTTLPDGTYISTVFLGLDHAFYNDLPVLFETMIFGGEHDGYCERYSTWEEAEAGHQKAIDLIFEV